MCRSRQQNPLRLRADFAGAYNSFTNHYWICFTVGEGGWGGSRSSGTEAQVLEAWKIPGTATRWSPKEWRAEGAKERLFVGRAGWSPEAWGLRLSNRVLCWGIVADNGSGPWPWSCLWKRGVLG